MNEDKRASMFTVRDAEDAMITFSIFAFSIIVGVFLHALILKSSGMSEAFYTVAYNISKILSASTLLTIFEEGVDIMFRRLRASLARDKKLKEEAKAKGYAQGYQDGYEKAKAENGEGSQNSAEKSPKTMHKGNIS